MKRFPLLDIPEFEIFKKLDTPRKIQNYLDSLPINFEKNGETHRSPLMTLRTNKAHCMEGAILAAAAFWYHGHKPLLLNLKTTDDDTGHAIALFKQNGHWGAISKTNHAVLRYRDPVYRTTRELAMSYFNEYFLDTGKKTMRAYSTPFNLLAYGSEWLTSRNQVWDIVNAFMDSPHNDILDKKMTQTLRLADTIEIETGKITEWKRNDIRSN